MTFQPGDLIMIRDFGKGAWWSNKLGIYIEQSHSHNSHMIIVEGQQLWLFASEMRKVS